MYYSGVAYSVRDYDLQINEGLDLPRRNLQSRERNRVGISFSVVCAVVGLGLLRLGACGTDSYFYEVLEF